MARLLRLFAAVGLVVLVACTAQPAPQATLAPQPTDAQAPVPPTVAAAPQPTLPAATNVPPTVAPAGSDAIPIGKTPEGYNYLGSPNAPVTIVFYSDFF